MSVRPMANQMVPREQWHPHLVEQVQVLLPRLGDLDTVTTRAATLIDDLAKVALVARNEARLDAASAQSYGPATGMGVHYLEQAARESALCAAACWLQATLTDYGSDAARLKVALKLVAGGFPGSRDDLAMTVGQLAS